MRDSRERSGQGPRLPGDLPRNVLENLLEGCQVISDDFRYLYVNAAVLRHGQTTRDALLGRRMSEVYPGIEETEMFAVLRRCMEEQSVGKMENEFRYADGSTGWFELRFEPVPEGIVILSMDISDRKLAEASQQRLVLAQRTLSRCKQALIQSEDESEFVQQLCDILVDSGGLLQCMDRARAAYERSYDSVGGERRRCEQSGRQGLRMVDRACGPCARDRRACARAFWRERGRGTGGEGS